MILIILSNSVTVSVFSLQVKDTKFINHILLEECYWGCGYNGGRCIEGGRYGKCYCSWNEFDNSCGAFANDLVPVVNGKFIGFANYSTYFYKNLSGNIFIHFSLKQQIDVSSSFTITFIKSEGIVNFRFKINELDDFSLPSSNNTIIVPYDLIGPVDFHFDKNKLNASKTARLVFEIFAEGDDYYPYLELKITNHDKNSKLIAVVAFIISVIVVGIIIFICNSIFDFA